MTITPEQYSALVGIIIPLIVPIFTHFQMPGHVKKLILFIVAVLASLGHVFFVQHFSFAMWGEAIVISVSLATSTYAFIWKSISKKIEGSTGVKPPPPDVAH